MTTGNLAVIILTAIFMQVVFFALLNYIRRKRQYRELGTYSESSQVTVPSYNPVAISATPGFAWEGFREFTVQRRVFEDGNHSICSFYLTPLDEKPLPTFKPGQYLIFKLPVRDSDTDKPKTVVRCYSLSDSPQPDHYRISIKRIPAPIDQTDVPPGLSSGFFHDHVQEGSKLMIKAPSGHFHLMEDESLPIVLIGGGIGITPMLSILNTVLETGAKREILLYYGIRNSREHIMKAHLQALSKAHENFHLHVCYSEPGENDLEGSDYQHSGRVDIPLLRATLQMMRYQFYICGPKPMMESLVPGLKDWGVDSNDIFYEAFGPATLAKKEKSVSKDTTGQPFNITFSRTGKIVPWDFTADSLLEFAEANDIEVDSGCRAGSCGSCQTKVKSGEVDYSQEPDAEVMEDHCLLCISTPKSNLILDA